MRGLRIPLQLPSWRELNRRVAQMSQALAGALSGWASQDASESWAPTGGPGSEQWLGTAEQPAHGLIVGTPTGDPNTLGIEGAVTERTGGGMLAAGYADIDTGSLSTGADANAPLEIAGSLVAIGGVLFVEVVEPLAEEHYLLIGDSFTALDGRHFSPVVLGPRYVPVDFETFSETTDYDLDSPAVPLQGSTFTKAFAANDTTFNYQITLTEESSNRTSTITVEVWVNVGAGFVMASSEAFPMSSNSRVDVDRSVVITGGIAIGNQAELRVSAVKGHQQASPFVRGSLKPTVIEARQG